MAGKTRFYTDEFLHWVANSYYLPVQVPTTYIGLFSTAPVSDDAAGVELSSSGYTRQLITFSSPFAGGLGNDYSYTSNSNEIFFGPAAVNWPQVVAIGIWNAATAGTLYYWDNLSSPKTVNAGDYLYFPANSVTVYEV